VFDDLSVFIIKIIANHTQIILGC